MATKKSGFSDEVASGYYTKEQANLYTELSNSAPSNMDPTTPAPQNQSSKRRVVSTPKFGTRKRPA
jgi:hypothetical protein